MHPETHTGAPGQQEGQDRVSWRRRITWPSPGRGWPGGASQKTETICGQTVPLQGAELEAAPPGSAAEGAWHHLGGLWEEEEKEFPGTEHPLAGPEGNLCNSGVQTPGERHGPQLAWG